MAITFNSFLRDAGIDPSTVRLLRHKDSRSDPDRTPYRLWRDFPQDFVTYQARQSFRNERLLRATRWAAFVVTPSNETLFVGLYKVGPSVPGDPNAPSVHIRGAIEAQGGGYVVFKLEKSSELEELDGRLVIEWGKGFLSWAQRADKREKRIIELRREFKEEDWPGYLQFVKPLSEVASLPNNWKERLREAKGIYLLTCPRTKEQYIGKASGSDGFLDRWQTHALFGGDAVRLKSREPSDYQVSILEAPVAGLQRRIFPRLSNYGSESYRGYSWG